MKYNPRFSIKQINYFVTLSETSSLSDAASKAGISQSALSEAIDTLEEQLNVRLIVRKRAQGITLTDSGKDLLIYCRSLLEAAQDIQNLANGRCDQQLTGKITLGCYSTLAPFVLPGLVEALMQQHPEAEIELKEGSGIELDALLQTGECELAVMYSYNINPVLEYDVLYCVRPKVLLSSDHPLAAEKEIDLANLITENFISFSVEPSAKNTASIFSDLGLTPRYGPKIKNIETVRSLVAQGVGYSVLLHPSAMQQSYTGRQLVVREIKGVQRQYDVVLAQSSSLQGSRRSRILREFIINCFQRQAENTLIPQDGF
ncbi:LysR family transcriptional regulator [Scandinavium manionii]|uniref:LysR family transcriptional regulator n=1 Tax=Scandinavium manionii TaxID=2926520 RepID=UPI0021655BC2|nr:LysR family transcriptional regulator [Scandinavium manionii]MCS2148435.1 LysR family transcriptional regulator [Scandinavium manionii]